MESPGREYKRGPITVRVEQADEEIDIDAWVKRYVEIAMRIQGVAPGGGLLDREPDAEKRVVAAY